MVFIAWKEGKTWSYAWWGFMDLRVSREGGWKEKLEGEKVEDMVVMAKEWLGRPLECLQQPKGGRKVV
ncbi:unnamed protein product [Prunus armeniaca]